MRTAASTPFRHAHQVSLQWTAKLGETNIGYQRRMISTAQDNSENCFPAATDSQRPACLVFPLDERGLVCFALLQHVAVFLLQGLVGSQLKHITRNANTTDIRLVPVISPSGVRLPIGAPRLPFLLQKKDKFNAMVYKLKPISIGKLFEKTWNLCHDTQLGSWLWRPASLCSMLLDSRSER
jgi:hypothetical protein